MSYIQIDKKAATDAEAQALLDQTYALFDPLGTPTLFIRPEDFPIQSTDAIIFSNLASVSKTDFKRAEHSRINKLVSKKMEVFKPLDLSDSFSGIAKKLDRDIVNSQLKPNDLSVDLAYNIRLSKFAETAEQYDHQKYIQPSFSVVFSSPSRSTLSNILAHFKIDSKVSIGTSSQLRFIALWHEIAHGTGAGEPQADIIMATLTRQAFEDNQMITVFADLRAFDALLQAKKKAERYGWPMVEANDYILRLPEGMINSMSEQNIKDMRFQKFDHLADTVFEVSDMLKEQVVEKLHTRNLLGLSLAAQELREDMNISLTNNQMQILTRFELATRRLHHGEAAYQKGTNLISAELLESERAAPITFTPSQWVPSAE